MNVVAFMAIFLAVCNAAVIINASLEEKQKPESVRKACTKTGVPFQNQPHVRVNTTERLKSLRDLMRNEIIQAYIVTSTDEHMNFHVENYEKRLRYISGFGGSYAIAVITEDKAALWIDNRYHFQADEEIDCNWLLFKDGIKHVSKITDWIKKEVPLGRRVGIDPKLSSEHFWNKLQTYFAGILYLIPVNVDLIDRIWHPNLRGWKRNTRAFPLSIKHAGKSHKDKIEQVRNEMKKINAEVMVVTALDEIAWLLNIRGDDLPYTPVVRSYVILDMNNVYFYVNISQFDVAQHKELNLNSEVIDEYSIQGRRYEDFWRDVSDLPQRFKTVLVPSHCAYSEGANHAIVANIVARNATALLKQSPIIYLKAIKNNVEISNMETANVKDAAAFCECFSHIEERIKNDENLTESDVIDLLNIHRSELGLGNSFEPVIAFGQNSVYPFHKPNAMEYILKNSVLIVETGAQYLNGTTDLARTFHFGQPSEEMKTIYTKILIGLMKLSSLTFPSNMKMAVADSLIRSPLWEVGLDYFHDTGHGVGAFLNVEESPIKIRFDSDLSGQQVFKKGYFFTSEPGVYYEGQFGIKLGNMLEVVEKPWLKHGGHSFLGFKIVTFVPFEPNLLKLELLSPLQRKWLNNYNEQIRQIVGAELKSQKRMNGFYWMMEKTKFIPENGQNSIISNRFLLWLILLNIFLIF